MEEAKKLVTSKEVTREIKENINPLQDYRRSTKKISEKRHCETYKFGKCIFWTETCTISIWKIAEFITNLKPGKIIK